MTFRPTRSSVNGREVSPTLEKGYAVLKRTWQAGDTVELKLPMPIHRVLANAEIEADRGRVALERGPLVYCIEGDRQRRSGAKRRAAGIDRIGGGTSAETCWGA